MAKRVVDLTQPLSKDSQLHPFFPDVQIQRHIIHTDAEAGRPSFAAEMIITSNHAATHVDAFAHYDAGPDAPLIADMPLDTFCGDAIAIDVREYPRAHEVTPDEIEKALDTGGLEVREGDILLFCTDHYNRTAGTPAFLDGFSGVAPESVRWMKDNGVKIFGVETISPDIVYENDDYKTHAACAEHRVTHYENLNNLKELLGRRFEFYAFPLKLVPAAGSPVRAVGIVDD